MLRTEERKNESKLFSTNNCPGCYLSGVNLSGQDLVWANLSSTKGILENWVTNWRKGDYKGEKLLDSEIEKRIKE
jgi:uncharacterized protein YjbI with pentapeptide repeats